MAAFSSRGPSFEGRIKPEDWTKARQLSTSWFVAWSRNEALLEDDVAGEAFSVRNLERNFALTLLTSSAVECHVLCVYRRFLALRSEQTPLQRTVFQC